MLVLDSVIYLPMAAVQTDTRLQAARAGLYVSLFTDHWKFQLGIQRPGNLFNDLPINAAGRRGLTRLSGKGRN